MKVLLDTHAFLWLVSADPALSRLAKKTFEELRKERGQIVHQWSFDHNAVHFLSMVEIVSANSGSRNLPDGFYDVIGHSSDAIYSVRNDIKIWEEKLEEFNERLVKETVDILLPQVTKFNYLYCMQVKPK